MANPYVNNINVRIKDEKGVVAILALVVILAIAGAVAYFYFFVNKGEPPTVPVSRTPLTLSLESPVDGTLIADDQVLVKGKTLPGTTVVFYTDADENSVEADASGNFEGTVGVVEGINSLTVTAFGEDGQESTTTLDIVNDTEE